MFVTYTPEDGEPRTWEFKPGRIKSSMQAVIEKKAGGLRWQEWLGAVKAGPGPARRTLIWYLQHLEHPNLRWEDVDVCDDEVTVELSVAELEELRDDYVRGGGLELDENSALFMAKVAREIEEARVKFGDDSGKAPSRSEPATTSG